MDSGERFRDRLASSRPILADGAMGTMLHAAGVGLDDCFDALNLTHPDRVAHVHRAYTEAGAEILETNTFGANRYKLAPHGLEQRLAEINAAGVRLAREAADAAAQPVLVAGSVGPLGVRLAPFGRVGAEQARDAYRQQIAALAEAGADLIMIETQTDLEEARQALRAARLACRLPVVVSLTYTREDRTLLGDTPAGVARALAEEGAEVIGANCSGGPSQLARLVDQMAAAAPGAHLSVMPNAGWPERVGGRILYPASPDYFGEHATAFVEAGASIVGGCCGTTPAHIAAMRRALDQPGPHHALPGPATAPPLEARPTPDAPTHLASLLDHRQFVMAVEIDPPRGFSPHRLLAAASLLAEAGADVVDVADSPMARMRMSPWAACHLIQSKVGVETVLHFPTRGRNLLRIQGDLLAAHALGIRNVLVLMGDPAALGDYPEAVDGYDVVPSGLIGLIKTGLNAGVARSGADIDDATSFFTGCVVDLAASDLEREVRLLRRKVEAGADFALSQPVFDPRTVFEFLGRYEAQWGRLELPLLVGLLPLHSDGHAAFLDNEVPGIHIPGSVRRRMAQAGGQAAAEGARVALEVLQALGGAVHGAYLMPAFGRYDLAAEFIEAARRMEPAG